MAQARTAKRWIIEPPWEGRRELAARLGVAPIVAQVLYNRGLSHLQRARQFLDPQLSELHAPEALSGVEAAADRLARAVQQGERVVIYGDYDVDGTTGLAILWHCFRLAGVDCGFYVPHRIDEGYGLNEEALVQLAGEGARVVVTVDCGVTAHDEAMRARELGIELIVTDHHILPETLPDASVIVHPQLGDYENRDLSGSGVALKLAWALAQRLTPGFSGRVSERFRDFLVEAMSLAALGTVADVVPLTGENRTLVHFGLVGLRECKLPGIRALIEQSGLAGERVESYHVGFVLGPRLNAIGRMGHARLAVELLTRAGQDQAYEIAAYLDQQNRQRQSLQRRLLAEARQMVIDQGMNGLNRRGIVLAKEGWHAGVIGIVASKLAEEFCRPAVLISLNGSEGQGSARSVQHLPMHEALSRCQEHLISHGGHAMAGGLRIKSSQVTAFTEAFVDHANRTLTAVDLQPQVRLEGQVDLAELTEPVVNDLKRLGPFGQGNPRPRWATSEVELQGEPRIVGQSGEHMQLTVRQGRIVRRGIAFGLAKHEQALRDYRRCRLAFEPIINEFNGRRSVELQVIDFQWPT